MTLVKSCKCVFLVWVFHVFLFFSRSFLCRRYKLHKLISPTTKLWDFNFATGKSSADPRLLRSQKGRVGRTSFNVSSIATRLNSEDGWVLAVLQFFPKGAFSSFMLVLRTFDLKSFCNLGNYGFWPPWFPGLLVPKCHRSKVLPFRAFEFVFWRWLIPLVGEEFTMGPGTTCFYEKSFC